MRAIFLLAIALAGVAAPRFAGAAELLRLDPDTEVHALRFDFEGKHVLLSSDLEPAIATTGPGLWGHIHRFIDWMPFVPEAKRHPFHAPTVQADVERLRRKLRRQGFAEARVDYEVKQRSTRGVDVTFLIEEGPPLLFRHLEAERVDSVLTVPDSLVRVLEARWARITPEYLGRRYREEEIESLRHRLVATLADAGFIHASVEPLASVDTVQRQVDMLWRVREGPRVRMSGFEVEGAKSVSTEVVTRQVELEPGDWLSRRRMVEGRSNIQSVALFRRADVGVGSVAIADTAIPVRIRVEESRPRFTNLEAGYVTDGAGVTAQARWTHPNFTGGARSLDVVGLVQTGWGISEELQDKLQRATLTMTQYYLGKPAFSLSAGPVYENRDGRIDKSEAWSGIATLVYRFNALQSAALRYDYTYRRLDELPIGDLPPDAIGVSRYALLSPGLVDSLKQPVRTSQLIAFASFGSVDHIARPQHGMILKPKLAITAPPDAGTVEFASVDGQLTFYMPAPGRDNAILLRGSGGGVWPFGRSIPEGGESASLELFRLRDELLTAGGPNDVRAYGTRLLGPKVPNVIATTDDQGTTTFTADEYYAIGGLARVTGTAELRLGLPFISRDVFSHWFLDAGRVWIEDQRFQPGTLLDDEERFFFGTGGGLAYYTPVGAIRFDVGYKLNPSVLDERSPGDVVSAALNGLGPESIPPDPSRRWAYHLALGVVF